MDYTISGRGREGGGWIDIVTQGEFYRWWFQRGIVEGPEGTEYTADFWFEEWGIDRQVVLNA